MRCRLLLFALLSAAPSVWSQTDGAGERSPADIIDDCAETAPPGVTGITTLEGPCPGLGQALEEAGELALLSPSIREEIHADDLRGLARLRDWYAKPLAELRPDVGKLQPILDSLRKPAAEQPATWFERFKKWLRNLLERQGGESESWLSRWLRDVEVSSEVMDAIVYGIVIVVVVLAAVVLVNELRVAGLLRRRAHDSGEGRAASGLGTGTQLAAIAGEGAAPVLLRMLVGTLVRSGRLRAERSLTHRELCERATFDNARQSESFQRVAQLAERAVYGARDVPPDELASVTASAHALNEELKGATA